MKGVEQWKESQLLKGVGQWEESLCLYYKVDCILKIQLSE